MARLTRLMLVLGSVVGFSVAAPNTSQAGVIPWIYDAIFGPVGSMRYGAGYGTYGGYGYSGYSNYGLAYSGYTPTTVAYAPTTAYYGGGSCNSCSGGSCNSCSSCNTNYGTSAYVPYGGSSSCNNCSVGGSYVGSSQTTSYAAPDPNSISRDVQYRLEGVEHDIREIKKFLQRKHDADFSPDPYSRQNSTYKGGSDFRNNGDPRSIDTVRQRKQKDDSFSSESDPEAPKFREPFKKGDEQDSRKPELPINPPPTGDGDKSEKVQSAQPQETEPQSLRLDRKITTRAVAPKERLANNVAPQPKAPTVAKSNVKRFSKAWLDSSNASEVARH